MLVRITTSSTWSFGFESSRQKVLVDVVPKLEFDSDREQLELIHWFKESVVLIRMSWSRRMSEA